MKQLKKIFNHLTNILFIIILSVVLYRFYDAYRTNSAFEGKSLPTTTFNRLTPNSDFTTIASTELKPPYIIIFWSSTCPPCLVELARFNSEVENKALPADKIIAVNIGESPADIKKFMKQKNVIFSLYQDIDNSWAKFLKLQATPLVVHINKQNKIEWMTTGVSPSGIMRAKNLLKEKDEK